MMANSIYFETSNLNGTVVIKILNNMRNFIGFFVFLQKTINSKT